MKKKTIIAQEAEMAVLTVDGNDYPLKYSFNSLVSAEETTGCNLISAVQNLAQVSAKQLRAVLYAAITSATPTSTIRLDEVGDLIRLDTLAAVHEAIAHAYVLSIPAELRGEEVPSPSNA